MSGTTTDVSLSTDLYDVEAFVDAIKAKHIDIDEDTLTMGIYGYLSEIFSTSLENTTIMASEYANEATPTKAKFEKNVISHALSLGINSIRATPASMKVFLCFPESMLLENMVNDRFTFDKNIDIFIGDKNNYIYRTDYDIIIHHNLLPSGKYIYTAIYDMDTKEVNEVSDITNPYLPAIGLISVGATNLVMVPATIRQTMHTTIYKTILVNNPLETKAMTFSFDNQMAYFNVTVVESGHTHYLTPVYDGLTETTGREYCNYMYLDASRIRVKFNRDSYQPRANAEVTINIYTTLGTECNFSYSSDKVLQLSSERFSYTSNLWMMMRPVSDSENGKDRDTVETIKTKIPKQMLLRGSVTTSTDLNNYFNFLNNSSHRLYFLEKIHNQVERLYYSYLILKKDSNIIPTNTVDVSITRNMFNNINSLSYILKPGSMYYLNTKDNTCNGVTTTDSKELDTMDASGFLYMNPFLTMINKNPFFTEYYLNILDYRKTLNFSYINDKCEVQFISTSILMQRLYYTDRDTYNITMILEQNVAEDFALVNRDDDGNIIKCLVEPYMVAYDDSGIAIGYIIGEVSNYEEATFTYTVNFKFKTTDIINRNNKINITNGIYNIGTDVMNTIYLDRNTKVDIYILAKLEEDYGLGDNTVSKYIPNIEKGYSLCNIYGVYTGIDLYYDYTDLMTSYTTISKNSNNSYNYLINKMPLIRYTFMNSEDRVLTFVKLLEINKIYLESSLVLLEDSFGLDFKFFNTYGPSKLYNIDKDVLLNRTNLTLTFEVKFVMTSDATILKDITADIKDYLEDINEINDLHMPNLITYITNKYRKQLIYFKFIDLNGYGPIKQSMYREDIDAFVEASTVPEFLNVNTLNTNEPDITYKIIS